MTINAPHPDERNQGTSAEVYPSSEEVIARLNALWAQQPAEPTIPPSDRTDTLPNRVGAQSDFVGTTDLVGTVLGHYQVRHVIGSGGFGVVYLASDLRLHRQVALKIPRPEVLVDQDRRRRFEREARIAASLDHPSIVPILEANFDERLPYIASAYCPGPDLDQWFAARTSPVAFDAAARFIAQLAEAIEYAHDRGVFHRDLKPSNILLAPRNDTECADPRQELDAFVPRVTDFGLAKLAEATLQETRSSVLVGTPLYMPPEQFRADAQRPPASADVYAIGVMLYELLCGHPPFEGDSYYDVIDQISRVDPPDIRSVRPDTPRDLETIGAKCLEKNPRHRYRSARSLAEELRRWLAGEPIEARPIGRLGRTWRWTQRNPRTAQLSLAIVVALTLGTAAASYFANRARDYSDQATHYSDQATHFADLSTEQLAETQQRAYSAGLNKVGQIWRTAPGQALLWLESTSTCPEHLREFTWNFVHSRLDRNVRTLAGHPDSEIFGMSLSSDGKKLASGSGKEILLWDFETGTLLHRLRGHRDQVWSVAFSPDDRRVASGSKDHTIKIWDAESGQLLATYRGHTDEVGKIAFSPDGRWLASPSNDQTVKIWDTKTGRELRTLRGHSDPVHGVAFSHDGTKLASAGRGASILVWDPSSGAQIASLEAAEPMGRAYASGRVFFSPVDNNVLISVEGRSGDTTGAATLWDLSTEEARFSYTASRPLYCAAFLPGGHSFVTGGSTGAIQRWDIESGEALGDLAKHGGSVFEVAFTPDGNQLVSAGDESTVKVWDARPRDDAITVLGHHGSIRDVAFSPNGKLLATANADGTVQLWTASPPREVALLTGHRGNVDTIAFSSDGKRLFSAGEDRSLRIWEVPGGKPIASLSGHTDRINSIACSPDGKTLATGSNDRTLRLWDAVSGHSLGVTHTHLARATGVGFSQDGEKLVSASWGGCLANIWDVASRQELQMLEGHGDNGHWDGINAAAFSPDGREVATAACDGTIKLWDTATGAMLRTLIGHSDRLRDVCFSPDGRTLASACDDGTIRLWDATLAEHWLTLAGHQGPVNSVAFSPDGKTLVSVGDDAAIRLWHAEIADR